MLGTADIFLTKSQKLSMQAVAACRNVSEYARLSIWTCKSVGFKRMRMGTARLASYKCFIILSSLSRSASSIALYKG
jgi:hypothetical protein